MAAATSRSRRAPDCPLRFSPAASSSSARSRSRPISTWARCRTTPSTSLLEDLPLRVSNPALAGRVAIDGFLAEPDSIHVRGEIERLQARYGDLTIAADPFTIAGDPAGLRIESLRLHSDGSTLLVSGTIPLGNDREVDLRAEGDLPLELLSTTALQLDGDAHLEIEMGGPWRSPRVAGVARAADVAGRIGSVDWRDVAIEARLSGTQIVLDRAAGRLLGGTFERARRGGDRSADRSVGRRARDRSAPGRPDALRSRARRADHGPTWSSTPRPRSRRARSIWPASAAGSTSSPSAPAPKATT